MRKRMARSVLFMLLLAFVGPLGLVQAKTVASQSPGPISGQVTVVMGGSVATGLTLVGGLSITRPVEKVPLCPGSGVCTGDLWEAIADLEQTAAGVSDAARHEVAMNAIRNMKGIAAELDAALGGGGGDLDGDGYPDLLRTYRPGRPTYGNITLRRPFTFDPLMLDWSGEAMSGKAERKSGSIILLDREGNEVLRINFFEAWPVRYQLSFDDGLVEEIELAVERLERVADTTGNKDDVPATRAPVQLESNGVLVGRFESATPVSRSLHWGNGGDDCDDSATACTDGRDDDCDGVADTCPTERPVRCENGSCVTALLTALEDLEQQVETIASKTRHDTSKNAIGNIRARVAEVDSAVQGAYQPGRPVFGTVAVSRTFTGASAAEAWFSAEKHGGLTLRYLGPEGKSLATVDLGEAWPLAYGLQVVDGQLVETLVFRPARGEVR